jgi:DNA-binding NtrC family response regulator
MGIFGKRLTRSIDRNPIAISTAEEREPIVVVVEDGTYFSDAIYEICHFLSIKVEHLSSEQDLIPTLADLRPMAVMAALDAIGQDGCHVMKTVAHYDPTLPILLLTEGNPALTGAADAVEEIWGLSHVTKHSDIPSPAELVEFLFHAGQESHCLGLMPV